VRTSLYFEWAVVSGGVELRLIEKPLLRKADRIPVDAWADRMADRAFSGISRVLGLLDQPNSTVQRTEHGLYLDHATVATLTEPQALGLGFPPSVRARLQVNSKNLITDPDFTVSSHWVGEANRTLRANRNGALLTIQDEIYRIPDPIFSLVDAIDSLSADDVVDSDVRMARLARLQALIPKSAQDQISVDAYFSSFQILHASAFSLSLRVDQRSFAFEPVLFGRRIVEKAREDDMPVSEAESLLTDYQQQIFARERFRASQAAKASYVIEAGLYVYVDDSLRHALTVVRHVQDENAEVRKRFVQAPCLYLKENLSNELSDDDVESLFVETEQYSARVIDVGVWVAPVLPWIKRSPNDWLPEKFGLQIGGQYVELSVEELHPLREMIQEARARGDSYVDFGEDQIRIPVTPESERALADLIGEVKPPQVPDHKEDMPDASPHDKHVLLVEENFEELGFQRRPPGMARRPAYLEKCNRR
jgi:hypothetical protein